MAEGKYNVLVVPANQDRKIYSQPWYKERLQTRYIKSLGPEDTSRFLIGKNWTFMKDGLDDFRDGLPPTTDSGILIKGQKGLAPNIQGSSDDIGSVKQPVMRERFNKHEVCFSRVTPLQQQRRDHIDEIEYGLTQHPLALYPHLEECLPPEVFEDVVDILDPEMNLASDEENDEFYEDEEVEQQPTPPPRPEAEKEDEEVEQQPTKEEEIDPNSRPDGDSKLRNPYRWLPRKEEKEKKDRKKAAERRTQSPSQDEHIKKVTKEFCDWVEDLGGESNNIEESTITSLFASGYETKPALSVPIHVVELTNVPPELRQSAAVPQTSRNQRNVPLDDEENTDCAQSEKYTPSWVKFKYGAWYLDPKSWKKRTASEPLHDPKELKDQEESEAKKKSNEMDKDLAPMHGAKAFMDFVDKKNTRRPEFLNRVADIQEVQAREEQAKIEAEIAKQKKLASRRQASTAS